MSSSWRIINDDVDVVVDVVDDDVDVDVFKIVGTEPRLQPQQSVAWCSLSSPRQEPVSPEDKTGGNKAKQSKEWKAVKSFDSLENSPVL